MTSPHRRPLLIVLPLVLAAGVLAGWASTRAVAPEPSKVATVDTLALVQRMLSTDAFAPARESLSKELTAGIEPVQVEMQAMEVELRQLDQASQRFQELFPRYQQLTQDLQRLGREAERRFGEMSAAQVADAYKAVRTRSIELATQRGYTHLLSSRADADLTVSGGIGTVTQDILARPVLMTPPADDLTEAVRVAMELPETLPDAPVPAPIPAPAEDNG